MRIQLRSSVSTIDLEPIQLIFLLADHHTECTDAGFIVQLLRVIHTERIRNNHLADNLPGCNNLNSHIAVGVGLT